MAEFDCSISAAAAAAWGVAAEVPANSGKFGLLRHWTIPLPVAFTTKPRKELLTRAVGTKSGFWRGSGVARRMPEAKLSNRIGSPPAEEKGSSSAGVVPHF